MGAGGKHERRSVLHCAVYSAGSPLAGVEGQKQCSYPQTRPLTPADPPPDSRLRPRRRRHCTPADSRPLRPLTPATRAR